MNQIWVNFKLSEYHEQHYKIAVSLPDLVQATNAFSVKNRKGCTPSLQGSDPKDLFLKYNVKCNLADSDPQGHEVKVHFDVSKVTPDMRANDLDIRCACSCPAFLYWGAQWNLSQKDGLEGSPRPLLKAPTQRLDLRRNFVICKHCKAVFERILPSVQHNIINIVRERDIKKRKPTAPPSKERLQREQERMKQRQELLKKRKRKNLQIQRDMMETLRKQEEEKLLKEQAEAEEEVERNVPAATPPAPPEPPTPAVQKKKLEPKKPIPPPEEQEGHEHNHELLNQMLEEEKDKLKKQQDENRKNRKKKSSWEEEYVYHSSS